MSARPAGKRDTATVVILSPPPPPPLPLSLWQVVSGAQLTAAGDAVLAGVRGLLATETVELGAAAQVAPEPAIQAPFNPIQPHSTPYSAHVRRLLAYHKELPDSPGLGNPFQ